MSEAIKAIRGMNDILPEQSPYWNTLYEVTAEVFAGYGYRRIRMPIAEKTPLFKRSIGEVTDIVEKEMYTFEDRSGDSITLRPEGTAGCVRAGIEHGLFYNQVRRLWYAGPMFRHERPQKGRYRQFHQIGLEAFGLAGPDVDAEVIAMTARLWRLLGVRGLRLEINSLGTPESRARYHEVLTAYFRAHFEQLDEDSRRRLESNPLRILDSKNPDMQSLLERAPKLGDHLDEESVRHFQTLCAQLDGLGIDYVINPCLVRGLDYYTRTVFEWVTDELGAQSGVCSGGRYDGLVAQLGGKATPAIGFAMGVERLVALMQAQDLAVQSGAPEGYLVCVGQDAQLAALGLAERLRDALPGLRLQVHAGGGSFKSQLKAADRSGAGYALILGESEVASRQVQFKPLRLDREQKPIAWDALPDELARFREETASAISA